MQALGRDARGASEALARATTADKNAALEAMADALTHNEAAILEANREDMAHGEEAGLSPALLDRLKLDSARIAGMAELGNVDLQLDPARCELLLRRTEALFPGAGDVSQARYWCGLRPSTPSNLPCIGRTPYPNLYLDTGHGTLGWTHACGSGRALADIVCGRRPEIDFPFRA